MQPYIVACRWQAKVFWCKEISNFLQYLELNNKGGMYMVENVALLDHFVPICCWYVVQNLLNIDMVVSLAANLLPHYMPI